MAGSGDIYLAGNLFVVAVFSGYIFRALDEFSGYLHTLK